MRIIHLLISFGILIGSTLNNHSQNRQHPFALVSAQELVELRTHFYQHPYNQLIEEMKKTEAEKQMEEPSLENDRLLVLTQTALFVATANEKWAEKAFSGIEKLAQDSMVVNNPFSFGLSRAAILRDLALAYDFCFPVWSDHQRKLTADVIYQLMLSVQASMGPQSNNRLESNWMAVRWGSVLLASVILDDELNDRLDRRSIILAHRWDARERIRDHVRYAYTPTGWFVESMGYQLYKGRFLWPALIAYQNSNPHLIDFEELVPNLLGSFRQHVTGTVAIPKVTDVGIRPDLANDNAISVFEQWPFWLRLLNNEKTPCLRWMHDHILQSGPSQWPWQYFYSLLFALPDAASINPQKGGLLNYLDPDMGVVMFRNRFRDENDIVATFNTSSIRSGGHAGPDNLSFRISGLGGVWAVGIGRTGDPTGQTTLFPGPEVNTLIRPLPAGKLLDVKTNPDNGSGYALGYGSCVGVENHFRYFLADYSVENGAEGVFLVLDNSDNGRIWRMHTPGFNSIEIIEDGVLITTPNQNTMKLSVPGINNPQIRIDNVRYGGTTERHNPGIGFHGKRYFDNYLINIACEGDILVVITLQEADKPHPYVKLNDQMRTVKVGQKTFSLPSNLR